MIRPFNSFIEENKVKKIIPNFETAKSLIRRSESFLKFCESAAVSEETAPAVFINAYEAAREAGQSLLCKAGFKPFSHEAIISFLNEKYPQLDKSLLHTFDKFRELRNRIVYDADKVSIDEAKEAIDFARKLIGKIKTLK